jgi:hypothetical protein
MHANDIISTAIMTSLFMGGVQGWQVQFWSGETCAAYKTQAADTTRGGERNGTAECSMIGMTEIKAMLIHDWQVMTLCTLGQMANPWCKGIQTVVLCCGPGTNPAVLVTRAGIIPRPNMKKH